MNCPSPHCTGVLHTGVATGFCTLCRLPASICRQCHAWNRAFANVCRQCGRAGTLWEQMDSVEPEALHRDPRRTAMPQQISTPPQAASGFLWAMGEGGDLYRLSPYAQAGEQLEVHDRFWAQPQPHAFTLGRLPTPRSSTEPATSAVAAELCAVVALEDRLLLSGLFSRQRRPLLPMAGETFLVNSRDAYQSVVAFGTQVYLLSRYAGQIAFCEIDALTGETRRFSVGYGDTAICGPALLRDAETWQLVLWSSTSLWVYAEGELKAVTLPEAVELWTAPREDNLKLPPGRLPAIGGSGQLLLPAQHFGRPALVRLARTLAHWSTTAIAVTEDGTLSESTDGDPLLSAANGLLVSTGSAFRSLVQDTQIDTRLPAWAHKGLALFFCQTDYGGWKQWVKAYLEGAALQVSWTGEAQVHACSGFWNMGTALCSVCVSADRGLRTEFLSWCV